MAQITVENLSKSYGLKTLFKDINFVINPDDKIGIVGINGTGKSTLLKILAGIESPDDGTILKSKGTTMAYLPQDPIFYEDKTVLEQVLHGDSPLFVTLRAYERCLLSLEHQPSNEGLNDQLMALSEKMTSLGAWELESQIKTILNKLQITDYDAPIRTLSGGQKKRVALASALLTPCDLLILDEPTNHMDNDTIAWLEDYLKQMKGALLMITHDRYFLDRVAKTILEIDHGGIYRYDGNYTLYLEKKMERIELSQVLEQKRQNLFRRELAWIRRGAKARSTKQKARIQRFEDLEDQSYLRNDQEVEILVGYTRLGKKTIEFNHVSKSYGNLVLFEDFDYLVQANDRIGIIGSNGKGKTTLLKCLLGLEPLTSGTIELGPTLNIGYFSQEADEMDERLRAIDYIKETAEFIQTKDGYRLSASQMMERFLFDDPMQYAPIHSLSGGEKRRLSLLKTLMMAPNVLIFDEPTNDLDIDTLKVLEAYLDDFEGIVLTVSHDRYFLDRVCNKIFAFEASNHIRVLTGNHSDYLDYMASNSIQATTEVSPDTKEKGRKQKTDTLKMTYKEQEDFKTIDDQVEDLESQLEQIEGALKANESDFVKLSELMAEKEHLEEILLEKMDYQEYLYNLKDQIEQNRSS